MTLPFSRPDADCYLPQGGAARERLRQVTHLCVAAHADDIEIMAYSGICDCLDQPGRAFGGVVATDGAGSARVGAYAKFDDTAMRAIRRAEQRRAAELGRYAIQLQLGHPSSAIKTPGHPGVAGDLATIFGGCRPEVLFLHNPADKHDTHVALLLRCLEVLRALPPEQRPRRVLGCEVWRDLDWLPDSEKVALDSGRRPELAAELLRAFDSQIAGGKRYDLAALGRRAANATFDAPRSTDRSAGITWAMDLTPLLAEPALDVAAFAAAAIDRFRGDVVDRIGRLK